MLSIPYRSTKFQSDQAFAAELNRFINWVKSSEKTGADGEILMPGEIEERTKARRTREGINIDETTWSQITTAAREVGLSQEEIQKLQGR